LVLLPIAWEVGFALVMKQWPTDTLFELKYIFWIKEGMTRDEVESILGPCKEVSSVSLDSMDRVDLGCEQFLYFYEGGMQIGVAFKGGRVCSKWFWAPSL